MTSSAAMTAGRPSTSARWLAGAGLTVMAAVLIWRLLAFLERGRWAVGDPHELDYGEGIVWQQMRMIVAGHGYAPLRAFPAIVFHYPPVYHLLTWLVASVFRTNDLVAGRALSSVSTLVAAALAGVVADLATVGGSPAARRTCGVTAALVTLTCFPVAYWSVLMRVDMVAVALTLGGLCLAMLALRRPALIYPAAAAFTVAVFTKQTTIAAPGAAFLVLLWLRPALAMRGIALCMALGLLVLSSLSLATDGQFAHHIFGYNINRFSFERLKDVGYWARLYELYLLVGLMGVWLSYRGLAEETGRLPFAHIRARLAADIPAIRLLIALAYLLAATLFLVLAGKIGASINYYIEWFVAGSLFVGISVRPAAERVFPAVEGCALQAQRFPVLVLAPAIVAAGALMAPHAPKYDGITNAADQAQLSTLTQWIRSASRPVISDNMVILREAGKEVTLEPAIVAELGATGVYDERPFIEMIRKQEFAFFVTDGERGEPLFDTRYNPAVAAAIYRSYPRVVKMADLTVHLPGVARTR